MQESTREPMTNAAMLCPTSREAFSLPCRGYARSLWILLLAGTMLLSACGGGASSDPQKSGTLSGNWQFSIVNTADLAVLEWTAGRFLFCRAMVRWRENWSIQIRCSIAYRDRAAAELLRLPEPSAARAR